MLNFLDVLTGLISALIFEFIKYIIQCIKTAKEQKNSSFDINGYWCSYHESKDNLDGKLYGSYELIILRRKNGLLLIKIYQLTSDGRKYLYKGNGIIRFDKLVASYEEITKTKSDFVGTIMLRYSNLIEHKIVLEGTYHEFRKNEMKSRSFPYIIHELNLSYIKKLKLKLFEKKYAFKIMEDDNFKNECKNKV